MTHQKKSSVEHRLVVVFGKKPRNSKTSKRYVVNGMPFYLNQSKIGTKNNVDLYYDREPYPLIGCFYMSKEDTHDKVLKWIERNFDDIKARLNTVSTSIQIPIEIYKKNLK